jgi:hypothetical protein
MRLRAAGVAIVAALLLQIAGAAIADARQRFSTPLPPRTAPAPGSIAGSVTTAADGTSASDAAVPVDDVMRATTR